MSVKCTTCNKSCSFHKEPFSPDYTALETRHNALVEAVHKAMDRTVDCDKKQTNDQLIADVAYLKRLASGHFKTSVDCGNRAFAAEQKYDALVDAVGWERECQNFTYRKPLSIDAMKELLLTRYAARAEVDRRIAESAADCKGEG